MDGHSKSRTPTNNIVPFLCATLYVLPCFSSHFRSNRIFLSLTKLNFSKKKRIIIGTTAKLETTAGPLQGDLKRTDVWALGALCTAMLPRRRCSQFSRPSFGLSGCTHPTLFSEHRCPAFHI